MIFQIKEIKYKHLHELTDEMDDLAKRGGETIQMISSREVLNDTTVTFYALVLLKWTVPSG